LGLTLREVVARATARPAAAIGHPELGRLAVGAPADIALFRLENGDYTFRDVAMRERHCAVRLVNTATYRSGALMPQVTAPPPSPWIVADFPAAQRPVL